MSKYICDDISASFHHELANMAVLTGDKDVTIYLRLTKKWL